MTIKDVCEKFGITADTLRYYEKVGAIPKVGRSQGGIREYDDEALSWVNNAVCLRMSPFVIASAPSSSFLSGSSVRVVTNRISAALTSTDATQMIANCRQSFEAESYTDVISRMR